MDEVRNLSILMGGASLAVKFAHDNPELFRAFLARDTGRADNELPTVASIQRGLTEVTEMLRYAAEEARRDFQGTVIDELPEITNI